MAEWSTTMYILILIFAVIAISLFMVVGRLVGLWFQAFVSGTPISLFNIIGMSLRKIPPRAIVNARINTFKAGFSRSF